MDQLIASCSYEMAALLQTLKETAATPVEALRILWDEIDFLQRKIPINHPAKGCNPRVLRMSPKLFNMLISLPHGMKKSSSTKTMHRRKNLQSNAKKCYPKTGIKETPKNNTLHLQILASNSRVPRNTTEVTVMVLLGHTRTAYLWLYVQFALIYFTGTQNTLAFGLPTEKKKAN